MLGLLAGSYWDYYFFMVLMSRSIYLFARMVEVSWFLQDIGFISLVD